MSCWVVPSVAAEYWGISLDLVLRRITDGLVPHMTDSGFVFVDVDPWATACTGGFRHEPPPTFVSTVEAMPATDSSWTCFAPQSDWQESPSDELPSQDSEPADECEDSEELPELDEEESATFGRLSWVDVRHQVSRMRRPPPALRN
jgi:hypothetical protein